MSEEEIIEKLRALGAFAVFVGRMNPMHLGHQFQIDMLIKAFRERHLLALGSCNKSVSIRHLFNYKDRSDFVRLVHPGTRIAPLPDFDNNELWFAALDDLIRASGGDPADVVFIGGSDEDVEFYGGTGRKVFILNRYAGITKNVSGAEVRDALMEKRELDGLLDPRIIPLVRERFALRWAEVRQK